MTVVMAPPVGETDRVVPDFAGRMVMSVIVAGIWIDVHVAMVAMAAGIVMRTGSRTIVPGAVAALELTVRPAVPARNDGGMSTGAVAAAWPYRRRTSGPHVGAAVTVAGADRRAVPVNAAGTAYLGAAAVGTADATRLYGRRTSVTVT